MSGYEINRMRGHWKSDDHECMTNQSTPTGEKLIRRIGRVVTAHRRAANILTG